VQGVLIVASIALNGDPFSEPFAEESTCGCQFAGVVGDTKDQETKIQQHREQRLAG
jgi:hypothetical protein